MLSLIASKIKYLKMFFFYELYTYIILNVSNNAQTTEIPILLKAKMRCQCLWPAVVITFRTVKKEVCDVTNHNVNTTSKTLPHVGTFPRRWILISNGGCLTIPMIPRHKSFVLFWIKDPMHDLLRGLRKSIFLYLFLSEACMRRSIPLKCLHTEYEAIAGSQLA